MDYEEDEIDEIDMIKENEDGDLCPECNAPLKRNCWSGEKCSKCDYWFYY